MSGYTTRTAGIIPTTHFIHFTRGFMNSTSIKTAFEEWWRDSYGVPPGAHAVMTHVAFAEYILKLLELVKDD